MFNVRTSRRAIVARGAASGYKVAMIACASCGALILLVGVIIAVIATRGPKHFKAADLSARDALAVFSGQTKGDPYSCFAEAAKPSFSKDMLTAVLKQTHKETGKIVGTPELVNESFYSTPAGMQITLRQREKGQKADQIVTMVLISENNKYKVYNVNFLAQPHAGASK